MTDEPDMGHASGRSSQYGGIFDRRLMKMRLHIKYEISKYKIYNEDDQLICTVRKKLSAGNELTVICPDRDREYTVTHSDGAIRISGDGMETLHCAVRYQSNADGSQEAYWPPAMAEETEIMTGCGRLSVRQTRNRTFEILLNDRKTGEIRRMMSIHKEMCLENDVPEWYAGLIFAAAFFMLHDDDMEIV